MTFFLKKLKFRKGIFMMLVFSFLFTQCTASYKAKRFNKTAAEAESKPEEIIKALNLESGMIVADLGSGGGYFSLLFAKQVGSSGRVYAVDINKDFLDFIQKEANEKKVENIQTILLPTEETKLPKSGLDLIFTRNVYHHLKDRTEYFKKLSQNLKPDGKIAIIDYKPMGTFSFTDIFKHNTPKETIVKEMENAGYILKNEHNFLNKQSFLIFAKSEETAP
ncbi:MAG: methyltransferase domain-containing protein [Leptospiraceae bacterium]|nr:methyltransferase domain-containing protein [Leptospiraceae bacterium]